MQTPATSYVLALDAGTTSNRAILFDDRQNVMGIAQQEFAQHYPRPGWVEHDPMDIYAGCQAVMAQVLAASGVHASQLAAIGITNQRETAVLWDKHTGRPLCNAIVWQCRRTADICEHMKAEGHEPLVHSKTGLVLDAYFSATKIAWMLDHLPGASERARRGEVLFGTVDSWLLWKLTGGAVHCTDPTNACRTLLYDIHTRAWDEELCALFNVPMAILPQVRSSSEVYGHAHLAGSRVPIAGIAGDQQAALFGQSCFEKGQLKNTYGTGCFMLMNTGDEPVHSRHGLLTTLAASLPGQARYALEGSVFVGGAVVQWLRDEIGLISTSAESEALAAQVADSAGVYVVPAFTGLGAPHWDMYARGAIVGLSRGSGRAHIVRAALESIAFQSRDVLLAMQADTGIPIHELRADGGASANGLLMQFQADITQLPVRRAGIPETTALGAAYLAGLAAGVWQGLDDIRGHSTPDALFRPAMPPERAQVLCDGWQRAVQRAKGWARED